MKRFQINVIRFIFLGLFIFIMVKGTPILWLVIFGASLIAALFFGRFFCGWVCPMNTLMIGTEMLSKKLNIKLKDSPKWLESGWLAWILLATLFLMMMAIKKLIGVEIPILLYLLLLSVIITLRYKPEVFHNSICPFGVLQSLTGRLAYLSRRVNLNKCIGCKLCEAACPSKAIIVSAQEKKARIDSKLCHQCMNCQLICPKDAVDYGRKFKD